MSLLDVVPECGEGWSKIIERTLAQLPYGVDVLQIKEKFGELRIHVVHGNNDPAYIDEVDALLESARKESVITCELCGETGELREIHGWWMTRCEECWEHGG